MNNYLLIGRPILKWVKGWRIRPFVDFYRDFVTFLMWLNACELRKRCLDYLEVRKRIYSLLWRSDLNVLQKSRDFYKEDITLT